MMDLTKNCVDCACTYESEALENAWKILTASKQRNFVAVQISPAVRVSIGEKFGLARGEDGVGKVVAALELLGADVVVDTAIASDALTLLRLKTLRENKDAGKGLPLYSSECSAWVAHAKENYPEIELLPTATTVCAKLLKKYYSEEMPDKKIRVIALEMGEAKKGDPGVDVVLTIEELAYLISSLEVNVRLLKKKPLAAPLGLGSGAGYIMAASGGDAEALARCLTSEKTQLNFRKFEYSGLYGKQDRREATLMLDGKEWKFAVVDSLAAADALIADVQAGAAYDYVEVMACAGGQVGIGCDLASEQGEMTRRLRKLGLKYLDQARAARSAEMSATAAALLKKWNALCRSGEADAYDVIDEIVEDFDEVEEIVEEVAEVEATPVEEVIEEVTEEAPVEEVVEEVAEEAPVEEVTEEVAEETVEEVVEEVAEEVAEEAVEETVEETVEEVAEETVEEVVEEAVEEVVEEAVEEITEEVVEEVVEEAPAEEEIIAEEAPVEDVFEEVIEEEETLEVFEEEPQVEETEEVAETVEEEVAATETPVEEPVVEEVVEEAPAEEPVVEEVVEEAPVEEPVVEEVVEEVPVEEPVVEEVAEEAPIEESVIEEVVEEAPVEEPVVEEVVEEAPAEEPVAEEVVEEAPVEEEEAEEDIKINEAELMKQVTKEELAEEMKHVVELLDVSMEDLTAAQKLARAHYYRRLSTKERRKLKRMRKKIRNSKK